MHYIKLFYLSLFNLKIFLPFCLLVTLALFLSLFFKPYSMNVKINNFFIAWLNSLIFMSFYIALFFLLRFFQLGKSLDLKAAYRKFINFFIDYESYSLWLQSIIILVIILLIILWLLIFFKIRKILSYNLWKLYFYYTFAHRIKSNKIYKKIFDVSARFESRYDLSGLSWKLLPFITNTNISYKIIRYLPTIILVFLFLYECILNDFVLYYIFYYFPLYMLIIIWIQISDALTGNVYCPYPRILFDRAYAFPSIVYVNLSEEDEKLLAAYLKDPLGISLMTDMFNAPQLYVSDYLIAYFYLEYYNKFSLSVLLEGNNQIIVYHNDKIEKHFEAKNLLEIDGKYFVEDSDNPEAMEYYKKLKNEKNNKYDRN